MSTMNQRIDHARGRMIHNRRSHPRHLLIPVTFPVQGSQVRDSVRSMYLVGKRPPLSEHPRLWRWLARFVYEQIGWAPDYGIEYIGIFDNESEARFAAGGPGLFYMELPLNASLPEGACQYGIHDFPHSEASHKYRKRQLPFIAVRRSEKRSDLDSVLSLETQVNKLGEDLEGKCARVT